jgi:hypothetical protein
MLKIWKSIQKEDSLGVSITNFKGELFQKYQLKLSIHKMINYHLKIRKTNFIFSTDLMFCQQIAKLQGSV